MNIPYLPHTDEDIRRMLEVAGVSSLDKLFSDIPDSISYKGRIKLPSKVSEAELRKELSLLSLKNKNADEYVSFLGGGIYDHYIPSVVKHLAGRSEFYTSYTPYQAETSQGLLQIYFEYQTMICELTKMDVSNASMYDGATALAEAALMAYNTNGRKKVLLTGVFSPETIEVVRTYTKNSGITVETVAVVDGVTDLNSLKEKCTEETACVLVQQPNFFGCLEDVFEIEKLTHVCGALFIVSVDPLSLGLVVPPGDYNADIVVGEGQGLGNEMNFGGPLLGFFAAKKEFVRRMPGRIIGETVDKDGKRAFTLTLQTREQHIRREKATSNICSNEALCATSATIYLAWLGREGVREVAKTCASNAHYAAQLITKNPNYKLKFSAPFFKEFVIETNQSTEVINKALLFNKILNLIDLGRYFPDLKDCLLICVTEKRTTQEIEQLAEVLGGVK
ncbi:MAG: glycine dehydrogenase (aminomethyl-transferring) [Candidatus Firestonebacteria bacterium RIFOXYA2_FULL_40_8]|nr:MAG: glycine dehydrogenase (aminomethyl-transferring) [Candidatus Firestonebacteria bacterium RIFOXYA2_FULL_40_8]